MKRALVGHNVFAFDCIALARDGVRFSDNVEDTLIAHHAFASHFPQRLDHVASMYCDANPWKIENGRRGGKEEKGLAPHLMASQDLCRYNAADCRMEIATWNGMQGDIESERAIYEVDKRIAMLCARVQIHGMLVDQERRTELAEGLRTKAVDLLERMRSLCGKKDFTPARLGDLRDVLYGRFGAPVLMPTATGKPSTSATTLQTLRRQDTRAGNLADLTLKWRSATKHLSVYLDSLEIYRDGRVHYSWKGFGTVNGRWSSRAQQFPRNEHPKDPELEDRIREIYVAPPGHTYLYFDLSQAEMRGAAQLSGDPNFIRATLDKDVHAANARICFRSVPGALEALEDPKGKGKHYRDLAKNVGFAVNYLASEETLFLWIQGKDLPVPVPMSAVRMMLHEIKTEFSQHFKYIDSNIALCQKQGHLRSPLMGRIRWFGWYPKPTDIANFPVQTFVADLMNERLLFIQDEIDRREWSRDARLIFQGHDSALYETKNGRVQDMRGLITDVWGQEVTIPASGRHFQMPIDFKEGHRLSDVS